jgi:hypothetical protein
MTRWCVNESSRPAGDNEIYDNLLFRVGRHFLGEQQRGGFRVKVSDLAVAVADGADCVDGVGQLWRDREHVIGRSRRQPSCGSCSMSGWTARSCPVLRAVRAAPDHDGWPRWDVNASLERVLVP